MTCPGAAHQRDQNAVLDRREMQFFAAHGDLPPRHIQFEMADAQAGFCRGRPLDDAAQQRMDARDQFFRREGLDDVIVRAFFQRDHFAAILSRAADDDHRQQRIGAHLPQHFQTIHVRQIHIQQNKIRLRVGDFTQGDFAGVGSHGTVAGSFQQFSDEVGGIAVVFDNQD